MRSIELFTGAGGLAIGTALAGFHHEAVVEWNPHACETLRANKFRGLEPVAHWPIHQADIHQFDFSAIQSEPDLLAGGPPCQPFSIGGKHRGAGDERNLFPAVFRAVRELRPRVVMIENVKGLLRQSFSRYFEYILLQISYPEIIRRDREDWRDHLARLECHHTVNHEQGLEYRVVFRLLNAADYGVPQRRERVIFVAVRSDVGIEWSFPSPTHSHDALLWAQWISGEYWDAHHVAMRDRPLLTPRFASRVEQLQRAGDAPSTQRWLTVRDALRDLPDPERHPKEALAYPNHTHNPGARAYTGHTGSQLDEAAKTLKAGDHGVPGGENMLAYPDGRVRYFTVRESARLQTFPDDFIFMGAWTEAMRQLGNAVPVTLARTVATEIHDRLRELA